MYGDEFDTLNPTFEDVGSWVEDSYEPYDYYYDELPDDDFPMYLEYDEGENDMYADGDFFTNEPPF